MPFSTNSHPPVEFIKVNVASEHQEALVTCGFVSVAWPEGCMPESQIR
jgi:hypothetical protein